MDDLNHIGRPPQRAKRTLTVGYEVLKQLEKDKEELKVSSIAEVIRIQSHFWRVNK